MDIEERDALYNEVAKSSEASDWKKVIELSFQLTELNIPDLEKSIAWMNAGKCYGHLKNLTEALNCYDKAVKMEHRHNRFYALENKAAFLAEHGQYAESLEVYRRLLDRSDLYLADYQRFQQNIAALQQHV